MTPELWAKLGSGSYRLLSTQPCFRPLDIILHRSNDQKQNRKGPHTLTMRLLGVHCPLLRTKLLSDWDGFGIYKRDLSCGQELQPALSSKTVQVDCNALVWFPQLSVCALHTVRLIIWVSHLKPGLCFQFVSPTQDWAGEGLTSSNSAFRLTGCCWLERILCALVLKFSIEKSLCILWVFHLRVERTSFAEWSSFKVWRSVRWRWGSSVSDSSPLARWKWWEDC